MSFLFLKVGLHKGDYRSKLVPFEAQKNILYIQKGPSLERFTPYYKYHFSHAYNAISEAGLSLRKVLYTLVCVHKSIYKHINSHYYLGTGD